MYRLIGTQHLHCCNELFFTFVYYMYDIATIIVMYELCNILFNLYIIKTQINSVAPVQRCQWQSYW